MVHTEHNYKSSDGLNTYSQYWAPDSRPKAVICVVHGMGEHGGRYNHMVDYFVPKGYAIFALDHRGHGKSAGQRGHTPGFDNLMDDVKLFLAEAGKLFHNVPQFLYGHSMGGNVVLNYAIRRQPKIKGVIASAPYLRLSFSPPAWKVSLGKAMAGLIPGLSQSTNLEVEAISRDTKEVQKYKDDKLNHDKITAKFFVSIHPAGEWVINHGSELTMPALVYHGTADRLTSHDASKEFAQKANGKVDFKSYEGYYHELHNDTGKESVLADVEHWIAKHL